MPVVDIETKHLAAFLAIYEHRSFGKAATALGYSQAAVSGQIATLEKVLGAALFDRPGGPRPVTPTDAGLQFLPHAQAVFQQLTAGSRAVAELANGTRGHLSIASFESVSVYLLPKIVAGLAAEHPNTRLELIEDDETSRVIKLVLAGDVDAALLNDVEPHPDLEVCDLLTDPYVAIRPAGTTGDSMSMNDIAGQSLVGHSDDDSCQRRINESLAAWGTTPNYVFRSSDNSAIQAMVRTGLGISVMPLLTVNLDDPTLHVCPIDPPLQPRVISLAWRAGHRQSDAFNTFVRLAQRAAAEIEAAQPARFKRS